jgi:hypothetical protein
VAPLEMNAGTCWGKNTIDPSGRGIEKPRKVTLTFTLAFFVVCAIIDQDYYYYYYYYYY